jgi:hypothetical protein
MKTLVIHPDDRSTDFLRGLYLDLPDKTVITSGIDKLKLQEKIDTHARVIMCGHGSPNGLFSVGKFPESPYIIDDSMVDSLRYKTNFFIWCHADVFVRRHGLTGFHMGMFLSEMSECLCLGVDCTDTDITESNIDFAKIFFRHIDEPPIVFYKNVLVEYGQLVARNNPVAEYNHSRLFLNRFTPDLFLGKVVQTW